MFSFAGLCLEFQRPPSKLGWTTFNISDTRVIQYDVDCFITGNSKQMQISTENYQGNTETQAGMRMSRDFPCEKALYYFGYDLICIWLVILN